mmetsp:Transcript_20745/g.30910  ORF Transcript_20745/g.30910 Transcript_20745/m.30910 type:complete len:212 (-) Transcript_20745:306-941(-)
MGFRIGAHVGVTSQSTAYDAHFDLHLVLGDAVRICCGSGSDLKVLVTSISPIHITTTGRVHDMPRGCATLCHQIIHLKINGCCGLICTYHFSVLQLQFKPRRLLVHHCVEMLIYNLTIVRCGRSWRSALICGQVRIIVFIVKHVLIRPWFAADARPFHYTCFAVDGTSEIKITPRDILIRADAGTQLSIGECQDVDRLPGLVKVKGLLLAP